MIDTNHIALRQVATEVEQYAALDDTEVGELCQILVALVDYIHYASSPELISILKSELDTQLDEYKNHATIVEKEEVSTHKVRYLEWS